MRGTLLANRRGIQRFRQIAITAVKSSNIKFLLFCCIALTLVMAATRASDFMGWTNPSDSLDQFLPPGKGYAIVMNTWKRYDLLKQSISHYSSCPGLESIHIVWSEPNPPSDSLSKFLNHVIESKTKGMKKVELSFDINTEDSLNNRFKEIPGLKTDAVFSIDDDVIFPCSSVEFAFKVWQSAPDAMVGFVPRAHWVDKTVGTYSMVLSKAAFFHKKYLRMYTNEMPVSIKAFVTKNRNCEDIAMSFLVANATGAPPIWVKGKRSILL
ncbi:GLYCOSYLTRANSFERASE FAMILY 64 PROTEIN C4 [Salix koriyanagi]|uniref:GLYCOSYLTRANSFERASE FAMILY 64 PROTEIN C4 n=1 Tax=Salix koriyanagi TaxID=2511006 RepID=A0A9Q0WIX5_9ROSI|nr:GLYCOSYLTRANSFERASE FAMILY 64 PROTEIN C4 [Salix koriyanagi]